MRFFIAVGCFCFLSLMMSAQDFETKKYPLGSLLNFPSNIQFAEEGSDTMWLKYNTSINGSIVNKLLVNRGGDWAPAEFEVCPSCIRDVKRSPNGQLFIAASEQGIYKREGGKWKKFLDIEAKRIDWLSNGEMVIVNSAGLHLYNGELILEGNNENVPEIVNISDLAVDQTDDVYIILPSKLYMNTDEGWVQLTELSEPMSIEVDFENRLWVTDNLGEIGYYQEGVYGGGVYNNFATNDLAIDDFDVLWYADSKLTRNENGAILRIEADNLIDDALFISTTYVDKDNKIWVASNFKSGIASVNYLGNPSSTVEIVSPLEANIFPNPTDRETSISFEIDRDEKVEISLYDISGKVLLRSQDFYPKGVHHVNINALNYASGIYMVRIMLRGTEKILKLVKN